MTVGEREADYVVIGSADVLAWPDIVGGARGTSFRCLCGQQHFIGYTRSPEFPTWCGCGKGYIHKDGEGLIEVAKPAA